MRISILAAFVLACTPSRAAETASFLDIGVGARALGMGGAYTALTNDADSIYWNPAGLSRIEKREFTASHAALFDDTRLDFLAFAQPTALGVFAGGLTYLSQGRIEGRDGQGRPTAGYNASDAAVSLGYARKLAVGDVGATVKYLRNHIGSTEAQGAALDVGFQRVIERATFGAALRNLGPGLKFADERNDLPLRLAVGTAYRFKGGHAAVAELVNGPRGAGTDASVGTEYQVIKNFFLRSGYTTKGDTVGGSGFDAARGLTIGLGYRDERWSLDYAVLPSGELERSHRVSLGARF